MSTQLEGAWPYYREHPDSVILGVVPGAEPSPKPPVRIFLGTEEGQYRAERVFVWSVLQVRDPGRIYEIHLMNNVAGFDRRGWRTGFTCYRFAIPDFAGGSGKAIYNDVDQIYLADPALLFDLDLDGHGYLAIDARDTSVMLIDCAKMLPWWNRAAASAPGAKGPLTSKPAEVPGLWGELDPHWNARDLEYHEGRTKCLHYTALHQQPWNPFPEVFSYHQNPLAYIWHDLERSADTAGFEVFTAEAPSPGFRAALGSNRPSEAPPPAQGLLSSAAEALLRRTEARRVLLTGLTGMSTAPLTASGAEIVRHDFAQAQGRLPEGRFDAVVAAGIFERIPGGDANWVLRALFGAAERALILRIAVTGAAGVGSAAWWRRRIEAIGAHYPLVSWHLDAVELLPTGSLAVATSQVQRIASPPVPLVWALTGEDDLADRQACRLGEALGWRFAEKRVAFGPLAPVRGRLLGATAGVLDPAGSAPLDPPWPDILITSGRRSLPVARWIKTQSGGRTKLVHLGRPAGPFAAYDLIVAAPDDRLPIRRNVVQVAAPLAGPAAAPPAAAASERPLAVLFLTGRTHPWRLDEAAARELGRAALAELDRHGGSLAVAVAPATPKKLVEALRSTLGERATFHMATDEHDPHGELLAAADRLILVAGDGRTLAEAATTGRPLVMFELPRWHESIPVIRPLVQAVLKLFGGDTYRGTPLQQHAGGRALDWLTTRGLWSRPRDLQALYRSLEARGLATRLGAASSVATARPLDDLLQVTHRVRQLTTETAHGG